jgi:hypothetical protein
MAKLTLSPVFVTAKLVLASAALVAAVPSMAQALVTKVGLRHPVTLYL